MAAPRYQRMEFLAQGTHGIVHVAVDTETQEQVVLKQMRGMNYAREGLDEAFLREAMVLQQLGTHPNIVRLADTEVQVEIVVTDAKDESPRVSLVQARMEMDLLDWFERKNDVKSTPSKRREATRTIMWQLFQAVAHCHERGVMHRDIKPENILINEEGHVVLADFGHAIRCHDDQVLRYRIGTGGYRAPEILLKHKRYSTSVDVWSLGCVLVEMLSHKSIFYGNTREDELRRMQLLIGSPNERDMVALSIQGNIMTIEPSLDQAATQWTALQGCDESILSSVTDLLRQMLVWDPSKRISATDAMKHAYFADFQTTQATTQPPVEPLLLVSPWVQSDVSLEMRSILVDRMVELMLHDDERSPGTFFTAVDHLDHFLQTHSVSREQVHLIGTACVLLATKQREDAISESPECLVDLADNEFSLDELIQMELTVASALRFRAPHKTCFDYMRHYAQVTTTSDPILNAQIAYFAEYALVRMAVECRLAVYSGTCLAASAMFLARFLLFDSDEDMWPQSMADMIPHTMSEIKSCVCEIHRACFTASQLTAAFDRYNHEDKHFVANVKNK